MPKGRGWRLAVLGIWIGIVILCIWNREKFSVDGVLHYTPENRLLAAFFMMLLFALKSMSVFLYSGILYIADGILFPLPAAIALNLLGTVIMVSLPYWIGRRTGQESVERIAARYPKAERLRHIQSDHEFFVSFGARIINVLPSDILSLYMGANKIHYGRYLLGSVLGMLSPVITFPIMGDSITRPLSPQFLVSLGVQAMITVFSIGGYYLYWKKKR